MFANYPLPALRIVDLKGMVGDMNLTFVGYLIKDLK